MQLVNDPTIDFAIQNANLDAAERATTKGADKLKQLLSQVAPGANKSVTLTGRRNASEQAIFEAIIQRGTGQRFSVLGF
jgi:hypothetical protein